MKKIFLMLLATVFLWSCSGYCLDFCFSYCAKTGDKEFDLSMSNLNAEGRSDANAFIENLSTRFGKPRTEVDHLINVVKMQPADAFMALKISNLTNKPLTTVVDEYKANKGKGWGVIAHRLGIKPGSAEFHALKQGTADEVAGIKDRKRKEKEKGEKEKGEKEKHGKGHNK